MTIQELASLMAVISFLGGIAIFLFKSIVIKPLQTSIDLLNDTLKSFKIRTDKELELLDSKVNSLEKKTTRHDEQIKTLFSKGGEHK
ncbi:hypothetical protein [Paucisalibacillus globulus]|uniref:hypothetical protein n=1 Tax=Paucisalibacillus globulus TaxID=351095 RepID=UPI000BB7F2ED|nr:hypothetical protein [Paucisalibacillus globulus]